MGCELVSRRHVLGALTLGAVATLTPSAARATLLVNESFAYTSGSTIVGQSGGTGFSAAWEEPIVGDPNPNADPEVVLSPGMSSATGGSGNRLTLDDEQTYVSRSIS